MNQERAYLQRIHEAYPHLVVKTARLHTRDGQFSDILFVDEELIFRFPRSPHVAKEMAFEMAILSRLQRHMSLPIPNPVYHRADLQTGDLIFMGYRMIPGEPLSRETVKAIGDETALDGMATQLATFMRELHGVPVAELRLDVPVRDGHECWADIYARFREHLFPHMRPDAREQVARGFETFLSDPVNFAYRPVLRHGDFGGANILFDPKMQSIAGVLDFSFIALGDPAFDLASISCFGESFAQRIVRADRRLEPMRDRARFYRSTFALLQALYALRDNDLESFKGGMAQYI